MSESKVYIETYGCQMNVADSELVMSILKDNGFSKTETMTDADVIFVNTCSIRDNAEVRVRGRLKEFKAQKKHKPGMIIGVLGCMAERLKTKLLEEEKMVDLIAGPDAYRDLPNLLQTAGSGQKAINVILSLEETYADISPVRLDSNHVSAFVSISRGCNNMCSFCVVPFTRGRERSRDPQTIVNEIVEVWNQGYKEVTLLGQNVDKYYWESSGLKFAGLLRMVAQINPQLRVRFSTSYPQDMNDEVLHTMAEFPNICRCIHLPVQSGSTRMLEKMKRGYTREWYMQRIDAIKRIIPECSITTDVIAGFCSETEEDHKDTLSMIEYAGYDFAYMFIYSERPNTFAQRNYTDDVPEAIKSRRLTEIIDLQQKLSLESNKRDIGKTFEVLVENVSKKSAEEYSGRNSQNKMIIFPKGDYKIGDYVQVKITVCTSATLKGKLV